MALIAHRRLLHLLTLAVVICAAATAPAQTSTTPKQTGTPLVLKPDPPGLARNHRLILKDGSYQLVRQYEIKGDRVRYLSNERGDWEEIPTNLVDWDATRKWEQDHAAPEPNPTDTSPAMQQAAEVDKEEAEARDEAKARMPTISPGLDLPDEDGVFVLDTFQGTPELVELTSSELDAKSRRGLGALNPLAGQSASLTLDGAHSKIHLHVEDPAIYLSLASMDDNKPMLSEAITVNTSGAKPVSGKHGARSAKSGFAIVRVDERNAVRIVAAVHMSPGGAVTQDENVIPAKVELLPGKHWLRIQPDEPLRVGEYALVEILSASDISQTVWDFRVDPTKGDNPGSITPINKPVNSR
jgi:hypothetical protein